VATEVPSRKRLAAHHASAESISEGAGLPRQPTKNSDGPRGKAAFSPKELPTKIPDGPNFCTRLDSSLSPVRAPEGRRGVSSLDQGGVLRDNVIAVLSRQRFRATCCVHD